ncbi:hypothetical protein BC831DRAFT_460066 [Entophlyctis helioformis]|nr:hypothetical protein BC831DRAFT_460066 [Entophlyctis helioformis]
MTQASASWCSPRALGLSDHYHCKRRQQQQQPEHRRSRWLHRQQKSTKKSRKQVAAMSDAMEGNGIASVDKPASLRPSDAAAGSRPPRPPPSKTQTERRAVSAVDVESTGSSTAEPGAAEPGTCDTASDSVRSRPASLSLSFRPSMQQLLPSFLSLPRSLHRSSTPTSNHGHGPPSVSEMSQGRSSTSTSLLGDTNQEWGYPTWIERELTRHPSSHDDYDEHSTPPRAMDDSVLQLGRSGSDTDQVLPATPKVRDRRSMTSLLHNFRISRLLSEASLSTIPMHSSSYAPEARPQRTTASTLRASDIKLLVCLGDSLLTGLCVTAHPSKVKNKVLATLAKAGSTSLILPWMVSGEHRHNTCISGGGHGVVSVGRLLKVFSPDIIGLTQHKTPLFSRGAGFNFARTGSTVDNLADQVVRFVTKLRQPEYRFLENEWKVVFIWIGANDVFTSKTGTIARTFEAKLVKALQSLKSLISKALVCIVTLPDLSKAHVATTEKQRDLIAQNSRIVNERIRQAVSNYMWNDTAEFRVVLQPIPADEISEEQYDKFVSRLDGVHPNFLAQQLFAKCIWNNMFLPAELKMTHFKELIQAPWFKPSSLDYLS